MRFHGIHSAVVLVHTAKEDFPVRVEGTSNWIWEPTYEEYERGMLESLDHGITNMPDVTSDMIRMVELNFSVIDDEEKL